MKAVLGIDLGTSGAKCVLFDSQGSLLARAEHPYPLYQPHNGWAEQEPEDWYQAVLKGIRQCLATAHIPPEQILALGLSGQMHGLVMLDELGQTLGRSIIWCDQRTHQECMDIERVIGKERLIDITFSPALTGFTLSKILWVQKHMPQVFAQCRHILLPKDYIRYRLCGTFVTDVSDASGMQLLDIRERAFSAEMLAAFSLNPALFAQVMESPEISGRLTPAAAQATGLRAGTVVAAGAGDNAAAAIGSGVVSDGDAFCTIGTSGVVYAHTDEAKLDPSGRVHTFCCAVPGKWHMMGVTQAAGLSMQWLRNQLYPQDKEYRQINQDVEALPIGANKLLFLPYLMGERTPHIDPHCRGAFVGLSALHRREHLARAVMEGVSYSLLDCLLVLKEAGIQPVQLALCGGGANSPVWHRMLADLFGLPVYTLTSQDNAALGAAILAMVSAGLYPDVPTAAKQLVKPGVTCQPDLQNNQRYQAFHGIYRSLYAGLRDSYHHLATLA